MSQRSIRMFFLVGLLLFTAGLLFPLYKDAFIGDDFVQQWRIREFVGAPEKAYHILNPYWSNWYYRPLQNIWFLANRTWFGLRPSPYYHLQICWHLLAVSLLYRQARLESANQLGAILAAAIFAVSAHHQLTVGWISSIAIVMGGVYSVAAVVCVQLYCQSRAGAGWLGAGLVLTVLAMLAHESSVVLPVFLIAYLVILRRAGHHFDSRQRRNLSMSAGALLLIAGSFAAIQLSRPNANITTGGDFSARLLSALLPQNAGRFAAAALGRLLLIDRAPWWHSFSQGFEENALAAIILLGLISWVVAAWYRWAGSWPTGAAVRFGLVWSGLHLAFIYLAVWSQRPELLDSRHFYHSWIGVSLALGPSLVHVYQQLNQPRKVALQTLCVLGLLLYFTWQINDIRKTQMRFLQHSRDVALREQQLKQLLPDVGPDTRLFATRFILSPSYFMPAAAVWYDQPALSGGDLDVLKRYKKVTDDFFLFDERNGQIYNLMPELQDHRETVFLWREPPVSSRVVGPLGETLPFAVDFAADQIVNVDGDLRLAIRVNAPVEGWSSLEFQENVPRKSRLATAVWGDPGQSFRIRLASEGSPVDVLYQTTIETTSKGWLEIDVTMPQISTREAIIFLETAAEDQSATDPGFWANPRFTVD